jgi:hypothetical protein
MVMNFEPNTLALVITKSDGKKYGVAMQFKPEDFDMVINKATLAFTDLKIKIDKATKTATEAMKDAVVGANRIEPIKEIECE